MQILKTWEFKNRSNKELIRIISVDFLAAREHLATMVSNPINWCAIPICICGNSLGYEFCSELCLKNKKANRDELN